jgi:hypothetical protein
VRRHHLADRQQHRLLVARVGRVELDRHVAGLARQNVRRAALANARRARQQHGALLGRLWIPALQPRSSVV